MPLEGPKKTPLNSTAGQEVNSTPVKWLIKAESRDAAAAPRLPEQRVKRDGAGSTSGGKKAAAWCSSVSTTAITAKKLRKQQPAGRSQA